MSIVYVGLDLGSSNFQQVAQNGETPDPSIRPRQVIAVSLTNSMLSKDRATSVLRVVERELLTPRGLRTLSPNDQRERSQTFAFLRQALDDVRHSIGAAPALPSKVTLGKS